MKIKKMKESVFYVTDDIRYFGSDCIFNLKKSVDKYSCKKNRICLHRDSEEQLHEMLISLHKDMYYKPHRHPLTEESYFVISGRATLNIYDDNGKITESIALGEVESNKNCYARIRAGIYHDIQIQSEIFVYLETKLGPFSAQPNEVAPFAN